MIKKLAMSIGVMTLLWVLPLRAQDHTRFEKFTFSIGGGVSTPLNPTAQFAGVNGNFIASAGYKLSPRNSINGEFMWSGLPGSVVAIQPISVPEVKSSVYYLGSNYRYEVDRIHGSDFGFYGTVGGGWYYRYISLNQDYVVAPGTPCYPIYGWWGYSCSGGYVWTDQIARKGTSGAGVNAGIGFSVALGRTFTFFTEARYHYAFHAKIATTMIPVTLGLRFN